MQFNLYRFRSYAALRAILTGLMLAIVASACQPTSTPTANTPLPEAANPAAVEKTPAPVSPANSPAKAPLPSPKASPESPKTPSVPQNAPSKADSSIAVETCKVTMAKVSDPNPPLNLRSTPEIKPDNIVGKLENGTFLTVKSEQNGWFEVASQQDPNKGSGWISKQQTEHSCNTKVARIQFAKGSTSVEVADRLIGTGSHQYLLQANQGQTLTLKVKSGAAPYILAPDGKLLAGDGQGGDLPNNAWTGSLPASGDYKIALDSNFRGFEYAFSVEVK